MSEENRENTDSQLLPLERAEKLMEEEEAVGRWVKEGEGVEEISARGLKDFGQISFPEQTLVRIAKRDEMLEEGVNPYPVELPITSSIKEIREKWAGKLEKGAKREGKSVYEIADYYIDAFLKDYRNLELTEPDILARATDYIDEELHPTVA